MASTTSDSNLSGPYSSIGTALSELVSAIKESKSSGASSPTGISLPIGVPFPWPTNTVPEGCALCNGASFDTTKFTALYSLYSSGTVPDLRGMFIRGLDSAGVHDSQGTTRGLLSYQEGSNSTKMFTNGNDQAFYVGGRTKIDWCSKLPNGVSGRSGDSQSSILNSLSAPDPYTDKRYPVSIDDGIIAEFNRAASVNDTSNSDSIDYYCATLGAFSGFIGSTVEAQRVSRPKNIAYNYIMRII